MPINYTTKYGKDIETVFTHASYVKSHCKAEVDLIGAKSCRVYQVKTVPMNDYNRSGTSRYGVAEDVQDIVNEYTMTQDKAFTGVVDKGDASEQAISDKAGKFLRQQIKEQVVPTADKYAFSRMVKFGHVAGVSAAPTKSTIVSMVYDASTYMDEHLVPESERTLYLPAKYYPMIIMSTEWSGLDSLAGKQLPTGTVGQIGGFVVVKVPSSMFPDNVFFIAAHDRALAMPFKLNDTKVHENPVGVSGAVIEGRQTYDLFVLASKADAVYTAALSTNKQETPTISIASGKATITCANATEIYFTVDGSDPRFAMPYDETTGGGRRLYSAAADVPTGATVRAVGFGAAGKFTSDVAEAEA